MDLGMGEAVGDDQLVHQHANKIVFFWKMGQK